MTAWRERVREAARVAADAEARASGWTFNYRWEHVREVVRLAGWLARETGADVEVVEAAAWLHDVAKTEPHHALVGAQRARDILADTDFPPAKLDRIVDAIAQHEGLFRDSVLEPLEAAVLWDADKLSKLGATGRLHFLAAGFAIRHTTEDMLADERHWIENIATRTARSMNTRPGLVEAARRLAAMEAAHAALARELGLGDGGPTTTDDGNP